jgi:hypothetical protein
MGWVFNRLSPTVTVVGGVFVRFSCAACALSVKNKPILNKAPLNRIHMRPLKLLIVNNLKA